MPCGHALSSRLKPLDNRDPIHPHFILFFCGRAAVWGVFWFAGFFVVRVWFGLLSEYVVLSAAGINKYVAFPKGVLQGHVLLKNAQAVLYHLSGYSEKKLYLLQHRVF